MSEEKVDKEDLLETVVRICPACGVVNPAGPSDTCPHLQLVRFRGIDGDLEQLLTRVAEVRRKHRALVDELRSHVMKAAREGVATVEVTQKGRLSDVDALRKRAKPLTLTHPEPKAVKKTPKLKPKPKRKQKKAGASQVDPRQLALLVREPPQGDA